MKVLTARLSAYASGALLLGCIGMTTAQAAPIASAAAVVTFTNFSINWATLDSGRRIDAATDFASLSVTSSQQVLASMTGAGADSDFTQSFDGSSLFIDASVGTIPVAVTTFPVTATSTFNAPALPLTGNFAATGSNEQGSPIDNFGVASSPANLHNGSYASLDSINGNAGSNTNSLLASTAFFVAAVGGDNLVFSFDLGAFIEAYLGAGAAQTAGAGWGVSITLRDLNLGLNILDVNLADTISNNAPGSGTTAYGAKNTGVTGTVVNTVAFSAPTTSAIIAGDRYELTANITTRTNVARVVPEPMSLSLLGIGILALGRMSRKAKKSSRAIAA
jgi:hypothetical protein